MDSTEQEIVTLSIQYGEKFRCNLISFSASPEMEEKYELDIGYTG